MKKNQSKKTGIYPGARILSVLLTVLLLLNTTVFAYADEADLPKIDRWPPPCLKTQKRQFPKIL